MIVSAATAAKAVTAAAQWMVTTASRAAGSGNGSVGRPLVVRVNGQLYNPLMERDEPQRPNPGAARNAAAPQQGNLSSKPAPQRPNLGAAARGRNSSTPAQQTSNSAASPGRNGNTPTPATRQSKRIRRRRMGW